MKFCQLNCYLECDAKILKPVLYCHKTQLKKLLLYSKSKVHIHQCLHGILFSHKNNIEYRVNEHSRSLIHHVVFNYLRYLLWIMNFLYFPKSYPTPAIFFKQSYFLSRFYHQKMFCQINGMTDYFVKIKALIHTPNKFNQRGCFRGLFLSQYMPFDM